MEEVTLGENPSQVDVHRYFAVAQMIIEHFDLGMNPALAGLVCTKSSYSDGKLVATFQTQEKQSPLVVAIAHPLSVSATFIVGKDGAHVTDLAIADHVQQKSVVVVPMPTVFRNSSGLIGQFVNLIDRGQLTQMGIALFALAAARHLVA
jgi:hypothetical protein